MENKEAPLPEAPLSIHIDAYYHGFHTGITIRRSDNTTIPATTIRSTIESLENQGFKPSWNEETNKASQSEQTPPNEPKKAGYFDSKTWTEEEVNQDPPACSIDHSTLKPIQVKKEGKNKGKWFVSCDVCKNYFKFI